MEAVQATSGNATAPVVVSGQDSTATSKTQTDSNAAPAKTAYSDRVANDVASLTSGAGQSLDDQIKAYVDLQDLLFNGAKLYKAGNQDDFKSAVDAFDNSAFSKKINQVSAQYQRLDMSGSGLSNPAQHNLDVINTTKSCFSCR